MSAANTPTKEPVLMEIPTDLAEHPSLGRFAGKVVELISSNENPADKESGGTVVLGRLEKHLEWRKYCAPLNDFNQHAKPVKAAA